jgi:hypothetical protein
MMNEQDCLIVYNQLLDCLKDYNSGWVVEQVIEGVSEGKTIEETISGRKSPDLKLSYYSAKEQLLLLISSLEKVVLNTIEFESKIQIVLAHEMKISQLKSELCFTSPFEKKGELIKFIPDTLENRQNQAQQLQFLLNKLKQEVLQNAD